MKIDSPLIELKGLGPALCDVFASVGITKVGDLLYYLPSHYQNFSHIMPMGDVQEGPEVLLSGTVVRSYIQYGPKKSLNIHLTDGTGFVKAKFFHFYPNQLQNFSAGTLVQLYGAAKKFKNEWLFIHPKMTTKGFSNTENYVPVYPKLGNMGSDKIGSLVRQALGCIQRDPLIAYLPEWIAPLPEAMAFLHTPSLAIPSQALKDPTSAARRRLALEELIAYMTTLERKIEPSKVAITKPELMDEYIDALPYTLTEAQMRALSEICADMQAQAMVRLLQGDVGSGKTFVALGAAFITVKHGAQVAIMAPTEILSKQLFAKAIQYLQPLGITCAYLSSNTPKAERRTILEKLQNQTMQILVGTHALFTEEVYFGNLGLVVIDEQHRFGVAQRYALLKKGGIRPPHQLMMTATPIPRTLAMSVYAKLPQSILDVKPVGRKPIQTTLIRKDRMDELLIRLSSFLATGHQIYWVCSLVNENEEINAQNVVDRHSFLREKLSAWRIDVVHGQMKESEKNAAMLHFQEKRTHVLVATTVIEVGVDVPNATLMIIEDPNRLGLAQLHQLRGRVGRSDIQSYCILLYQPPISNAAKQRLEILKSSNDGFYIAEMDLKCRGPGEVLGTRQTGVWALRFADLTDEPLVQLARTLENTLPSDQKKAILDRVLVHQDLISV